MNRIKDEIKQLDIVNLLGRYPFLNSYLLQQGLEIAGDEEKTLVDLLATIDPDELEDKAIDAEAVIESTASYIYQMLQFLGDGEDRSVTEVTLYPGTDKNGAAEQFEKLTFRRGEVVCIVGPTGSGKSRLLADIEWMAQEDTPTKRKLLVNGKVPDPGPTFTEYELRHGFDGPRIPAAACGQPHGKQYRRGCTKYYQRGKCTCRRTVYTGYGDHLTFRRAVAGSYDS